MVSRLFLLFLVSFGIACTSSEPPMPELDFTQARALSDTVARDITQNDSKDLYNRLDVGFAVKVRDADQLAQVLGKMYGTYGRPVTFDLKASESGVRVDSSWKRPRRTFWYATQTTKYPKGKYFLKIEVVRAFSSDNLDVSGFGLVTFKDKVPDYLR